MNNKGIHDLRLNDNIKIPNTLLSHRRKQLKLTQKEVAVKMGISQSYISRIEKRIMLRLRKELVRQTNCV